MLRALREVIVGTRGMVCHNAVNLTLIRFYPNNVLVQNNILSFYEVYYQSLIGW